MGYKIIRCLLLGYLCLLVLTTAAMAGYWKFQHGRLLSVQTDSMVPTYRPGDALLVRSIEMSRLHPGQIISYISPKDTQVVVSHRLIAVNGSVLTTQGDRLKRPDISFAPSLVIGQVVATVPRLGYLLDFLHRPIGLLVAIYLPALAIIWSEVKNLARYYDRHYYRLLGFR